MPKTTNGMTAEQFTKAIERAGWPSVYHAGQSGKLGLGVRQLLRMAAGDSEVHPTVAVLLRTMLKHRLTADDLP